MERANDKMSTALRKNMDYICRKTTNLSALQVYFLRAFVISQSDRLEIERHKNNYDRCICLYEMVLKKVGEGKTNTYKYLIASLNGSGNKHILEKLMGDVCSVCRIFDDSRIVSEPGFACEGKWELSNFFMVFQRMEWYGLGFLGPVDTDAWYEAKVELALWLDGKWTSCGRYEKIIYAKHLQVFHLYFDQPIFIEGAKTTGYYGARINYSLKGPKIRTVVYENSKSNLPYTTKEQNGVNFQFLSYSRQIVELLFNKI